MRGLLKSARTATRDFGNRHAGLHRLGNQPPASARSGTAAAGRRRWITSTFENVSDIGVCRGLSL